MTYCEALEWIAYDKELSVEQLQNIARRALKENNKFLDGIPIKDAINKKGEIFTIMCDDSGVKSGGWVQFDIVDESHIVKSQE